MAEAAAIFAGFKWLASRPFIIDLLKKGYSYIDMNVDEKLQDLQNIVIPQIEMLIEVAENSPHKDRFHSWLRSLEEAVYEAEDVLDLYDYYFLEKKVKSSAGGIKVRLESLPPIKYLSKKFSIKLKNSLIKLEKTVAKAREFRPFLPGGSSNVRASETANDSGRRVTGRRVTTTSQLPHKVFGRDKQRDHIVDLLHETAGLEPESSSVKCYSVVAIVGLGGAGKTTLAQYVCDYEREAVVKHFNVIMWVHVSKRLDVEQLTKKMVESASREECPRLDNLDTLQVKLEGSLRSKKFLLVLDDVWSEKEVAELQWEQLLAPLRVGNRGSKILMTTRERGVAEALRARNILDLKELEKSDFLSLFTYYAFDDAKIDDIKLYEELEEIVRQNTPKLHGSPLAARMVGSQLRRRPDVNFWKRILSGDLLKDTMKSLLWSYQNLDAPLQRCFSYCSLFSKGQGIRRDKLIRLWIAEGFIKTVDKSKRIEDVGREYFDDLLSSSFFQPTKDDDLYTIHDLLHDLAEMVSKDRYLRVEGNLTEAVVPQEIRHLSLRIDTPSDLVEKICNLKNLHTLIILTRTNDDYIDDLLHNIFVKLKKLRVVDLGKFNLTELPKSIGDLKHLRYLDLHKSSFEILPKSVSTLYHLEFLSMCECTLGAKRLANWINLRHLYIFRVILNVVGIGCLKHLESLRNFQGYSIHINGLENVKEEGEAPVEIKGIEKLCLEWSTTDNISRSSDMDAQVLEGLRPPPHLQYLKIVGYQGCLLPSWMVGDRYLLHNLISLKLIRCRQLKQLPILSLTTLKKLVLSACSSLPVVSKEDLAIIRSTQDVRISQVVTSMEGLVATYGSRIVSEMGWDLQHGYDSQKLHNWLEKTMDIVYQNPQEEEEVQLVLPPSLESLDISSCPLTDSTLRQVLRGLTSLKFLELFNIVSLTSLPSADVLGCLTVLKKLHIKQCWFLTSLGGLQALGSLQELVISFCPSLSAQGGSTSILPSSLKYLKIEECYWKHLDDSQPDPTSAIDSEGSDIPFAASLQLGHLKSLWKLSITNCPNIGSLLGLQELNNLADLTLMGCLKLANAETKLGSPVLRSFDTDAPLLLDVLLAEEALASLQLLSIEEFKEESFRSEEEQVLQHPTSLYSLAFESCSIKSLPNSLEGISSLQALGISDCPNITSLPDLPKSLRYLSITNCPNIGSSLGLQELNDLKDLTLMGCPKLARAETKLGSPVLRSFRTDAPSLLHVLLAGEALASLRRLWIHEFKKKSFSSDEEQVFRHLTSLDSLSFQSCSIKSLPNNLESLSSLEDLHISDCPNIMSLPDLPRSLLRLYFTRCNPVLKRRCQKPHGQDWCKISHIREVFLNGVAL
ncbi:putative disease resistance protein RGA4 [Ananas comosus]|uniref:Disease resistance protein RGA4 n=1 Tax=Ananas comosus TaxID=4615 RepID=A0A6P5FMH9_ANACO|nr:putative disease resistance protein RGA4 [Ananas comosus]